MSATERPVDHRVDPTLTAEITAWLHDEAELLDDGRLAEWLELLTDDVRYRVPIRIHKEVTDGSRVTGVQRDAFHLDEDRTSLQMRVDRVETGFAWAEEPPSRLRHHITNVRVRAVADREDELRVRSNVLIYRGRWDRPEHELMSCERQDVFRHEEGRWKLADRWVVLDSTTIPMINLTFFF
ncbi:aromatic-ring-hydroxylating dioxygenase subunit beta [Nitriliruptor alkaliphilus]|uniref:aromatic-ring-hydroxylating dioxygenase subunit beta n=1 Tax=Nitriliruptor alkaliphilus TaxID=427918 RepID=UPI0009FA402B|nr:3-phenylpropionate/cinnamic acid dioxygenase subunit beta [Nitriliruptor alkaliphilus]